MPKINTVPPGICDTLSTLSSLPPGCPFASTYTQYGSCVGGPLRGLLLKTASFSLSPNHIFFAILFCPHRVGHVCTQRPFLCEDRRGGGGGGPNPKSPQEENFSPGEGGRGCKNASFRLLLRVYNSKGFFPRPLPSILSWEIVSFASL